METNELETMEEQNEGESQLDPREEAFCQAYTDPDSETYSNGTKSAIVAKYAEGNARTQAWRLLKRPAVMARVSELLRDNVPQNVALQNKVISDLERLRKKADDKKDYATAFRCIEALAKTQGMLRDVAITEPEKQRELTTEEQKVADRIAAETVRNSLKLSEVKK